MARYIVYTNTKDFDGCNILNAYYVDGTEAAWNLYSVLADTFEKVDLVDFDTGEVIESTEEEKNNDNF